MKYYYEERVMEDFISLVEEMRRMQRRYFQTRLNEDLRTAKRLESDVDKWIERHREERKDTGMQGSLI